MKYKPRFKWSRQTVANPDHLNSWSECNDEVYWEALWWVDDDGVDQMPWVILRIPGKGYFVGPNTPNSPREQDRGPFRTLVEAKIAAETLIGLGVGKEQEE